MTLAALIGRTWLRFVAPIAVLTAIVWAPIGHIAFHVMTPANAAQSRVVLRVGWLVAGSATIALLVLVGAVAPVVRAIARGEQRSQVAMLRAGLAALVRAIVPATIVMFAVAIGALALAVPGVLLYVLLVLAPASDAEGVRARIADSVAVVRREWRVVALVLGVAFAAIAATVLAQQLALPMPLPKKPTAAQLIAFPALVRTASLACAIVLPLAAVTLAAVHARASSTRR